MREWLKRAVLKTAVRGTVPGVRIPLPPLIPPLIPARFFHVVDDDDTYRQLSCIELQAQLVLQSFRHAWQ
jgi:hypothetical protein